VFREYFFQFMNWKFLGRFRLFLTFIWLLDHYLGGEIGSA
jgi:hypothetical protein